MSVMLISFVVAIIFLPWVAVMVLPWLLLFTPFLLMTGIAVYGIYSMANKFFKTLGKKHDLRVLMVDDDPAAGLVVNALFKGSSAIVDVVSDPKRGIRALQKATYDLIVLDYDMPRLNGVDWIRLADRVRDKSSNERAERTPVVVYSQSPEKFFPCLNNSISFFCRDIWHKDAAFTEILAKARSLALT